MMTSTDYQSLPSFHVGFNALSNAIQQVQDSELETLQVPLLKKCILSKQESLRFGSVHRNAVEPLYEWLMLELCGNILVGLEQEESRREEKETFVFILANLRREKEYYLEQIASYYPTDHIKAGVLKLLVSKSTGVGVGNYKKKVEELEKMLNEKNRIISKLQTDIIELQQTQSSMENSKINEEALNVQKEAWEAYVKDQEFRFLSQENKTKEECKQTVELMENKMKQLEEEKERTNKMWEEKLNQMLQTQKEAWELYCNQLIEKNSNEIKAAVSAAEEFAKETLELTIESYEERLKEKEEGGEEKIKLQHELNHHKEREKEHLHTIQSLRKSLLKHEEEIKEKERLLKQSTLSIASSPPPPLVFSRSISTEISTSGGDEGTHELQKRLRFYESEIEAKNLEIEKYRAAELQMQDEQRILQGNILTLRDIHNVSSQMSASLKYFAVTQSQMMQTFQREKAVYARAIIRLSKEANLPSEDLLLLNQQQDYRKRSGTLELSNNILTSSSSLRLRRDSLSSQRSNSNVVNASVSPSMSAEGKELEALLFSEVEI